MRNQVQALQTPDGLRRVRSAKAGFTIVEISIAVTILVVAIMATSASTLRMSSLQRQNRERAVAHNMVRSISENMHAIADAARENPGDWSPMSTGVWSRDIVNAATDGGEIGDWFEVGGLNAAGLDEQPGLVTVITDETVTDADLGLNLGMPRDLNGDGDATDTNVTNDASLLPIIVRVRWQGGSGIQQVRHPFYVSGY